MNKKQKQARILEAIEKIETDRYDFACHALGYAPMISFNFPPYIKQRNPTTLHNARLTFSDDTFIDLQVPEWFAHLDLALTDDIYDAMTYLRPFTGRRDFKNLKSI